MSPFTHPRQTRLVTSSDYLVGPTVDDVTFILHSAPRELPLGVAATERTGDMGRR